jgi:hypothetical protein
MFQLSKIEIDKPFKCEFCGSKYTKERTLMTHVCEQKRRHLAKNEKHVQYGYITFNRFYQLMQKFQGNKTYDDFAKSQYYNAFVKFGSFVSNVNPLYPEKYIDFVVTSGVKLDHWAREDLYYKYVMDLIRKESVETALERSIATMMEWANEKESSWNHYFNYASLNRIIYDLKDGKISPWLVLNCKSGKTALSKFNDEQLQMVYHVLDPEYWRRHFIKKKIDVELVKEVVKEGNL